jgi:hypothetical protein
MGTYSFYISSRNTQGVTIDWDSMNTEILFESRVLKSCYKECKTLDEVGMEFNESKLFGYLDSDLVAALYEFNGHLIYSDDSHADPELQGPTLYYEWEGGNIAYALEFNPKSNVIYHHALDYDHLVRQTLPFDKYHEVIHSLPDLDDWEIDIL